MAFGMVCLVSLMWAASEEGDKGRGYTTVTGVVKVIVVLPEQKGVWVVDVLIDHKPFTTKVSNVNPVVVEWDTTRFDDGRHVIAVNAMQKDQRVFMEKQYVVIANRGREGSEKASGQSGEPGLKGEIHFNPGKHPNPEAVRVTSVALDEGRLEQEAWVRLKEVEGKEEAGKRKVYREIVERYPGTLAGAEASRWLGEDCFGRGAWEEAVGYLERYVVWSCLVRAWEPEEGATGKGKVTGRRGKGKVEAGALYHLARAYEYLGKRAEAEVTYRRLLDLYPEGPLAAAARRKLGQ